VVHRLGALSDGWARPTGAKYPAIPSGLGYRHVVARDWLDYEAEHGFIRVRLRLLTAEEGGRSRPIYSDYRASWDIGNTYEGEWTVNDAPLVLEDVDKLDPGDEALARIHPIAPQFWNHVEPGLRIYAHEGPRRVGEATVIDRTERLAPP